MSETVNKLDGLIAEVFAKHKPKPPATEAQIEACEQRIGYKLPDDLRQFYLRCNGAALFEDTPINGDHSEYYIMHVEQIQRTRVLIFGQDTEGLAPSTWYGFVDLWNNNYVGIDLKSVKGDYCLIIDCFHESHGGQGDDEVIALSFTEFLDRVFKEKEGHYWLESDFQGYGNALEIRANDPDIIEFQKNSVLMQEQWVESHWKAIWRAAGKIVD